MAGGSDRLGWLSLDEVEEQWREFPSSLSSNASNPFLIVLFFISVDREFPWAYNN